MELVIIQNAYTQKSTIPFVLYADFLLKIASKISTGMYLKNVLQLLHGKVEEKRYSLEQLLEFANRKFGKTKEDLVVRLGIILAAQERICGACKCER